MVEIGKFFNHINMWKIHIFNWQNYSEISVLAVQEFHFQFVHVTNFCFDFNCMTKPSSLC